MMRKTEKMLKWEKIVSKSNANERLLFKVEFGKVFL